MKKTTIVLLLLVITISVAVTVDRKKTPNNDEVRVFAASSLSDVLPTISPNAKYQFAASNTLAAQIREGAHADVFFAANSSIPQDLYRKGLLEKPKTIVTNRVVIAVAASSKIANITDLKRGADEHLIVAAQREVPLGAYTYKALLASNNEGLYERAASYEPDARSVVTKLALGEADAGFVYATDIFPHQPKLRFLELPPAPDNVAQYQAAVIKSSTRIGEARKLLKQFQSKEAKTQFQKHGFTYE